MAVDQLSTTFAALADPTRREILARLAEGEATVNELAEPFPVTTQAISKHLKVLERAGLVTRGSGRTASTAWRSTCARSGGRGTGMGEAESAREIVVRRVFDAPREEVWRAWTESERLATWWGPRGWSTPPGKIEMDVRPGGRFRATSFSDEDGTEMTQEGGYREVVEPERLVFVEAGEGAWHSGAVTTVTFADLGGGRTEVVLRATIRTTGEERDAAEAGLAGAFDRLAEHLA
jgi:uncharacterized protein YndB with AHSA1/START domain